MLEVFKSTLTPMLTMFTCVIVGYTLNKSKKAPENTATVLSKCENYVIIPALVLNTYMKRHTIETLRVNYGLILYSTITLAAAMVIGSLLSRAFSKDSYTRNIYKYALTIANYGYMGNAIVLMISGEEMLYKYMLYTFPLSLVVYSWGIAILTPTDEKKISLTRFLISPSRIAMITGIILGDSGLGEHLPSFFVTATSNISACMGPLAMILTGFVIAQYNFVDMLKNKKVYVATFLRLIVLPLIFVTALRFIGAGKEILLLTFIAFGTPLGLNTVVFPAAYGGDTNTGASMAMISHVLCVITIPIIFAIIS